MNTIWKTIQDSSGVCCADDAEDLATVPTHIRNDYRWTAECQRAFLEALACTGSISKACREVAKTPRSAYLFRFKRKGAAFCLGWDAAILVARATLSDMLLDRAVSGYEEITGKQDDGSVVRGKFDNKLSKAMLDRLDKMAEKQAVARSHEAQVQLVVQDFEAFLDLIEKGATGAEAALFCAARSGDDDSVIDVQQERAIACELARISAAEQQPEAIPDMLDEAPEVAAERLSVWFDVDENEWRTNFPLSYSIVDDDLAQEGLFGDADYERALTLEEEELHVSAIARERQPWRAAAVAARDAWFGNKAAA